MWVVFNNNFPQVHVGYEIVDSQQGAWGLVKQ